MIIYDITSVYCWGYDVITDDNLGLTPDDNLVMGAKKWDGMFSHPVRGLGGVRLLLPEARRGKLPQRRRMSMSR